MEKGFLIFHPSKMSDEDFNKLMDLLEKIIIKNEKSPEGN